MNDEQATEYDEEYMVPVPNAIISQIREALRFYQREANYEPFRNGIKPVLRDRGKRAGAAARELDWIWKEHDRLLWEKWEKNRAVKRA